MSKSVEMLKPFATNVIREDGTVFESRVDVYRRGKTYPVINPRVPKFPDDAIVAEMIEQEACIVRDDDAVAPGDSDPA